VKGCGRGLGDISRDDFRDSVDVCGIDIVRYCNVDVVRYRNVDITGDGYSCCREDGVGNCGLFIVLMVVFGPQRPRGKSDEQAN